MAQEGSVTTAMLTPGKIYVFTDADWETPENVMLLGTTRVRRFIEVRDVHGREFAWVERPDGSGHLLFIAGLASACEVDDFGPDADA